MENAEGDAPFLYTKVTVFRETLENIQPVLYELLLSQQP